MYWNYREKYLGTSSCVLCRGCPYFRESTIADFAVYCTNTHMYTHVHTCTVKPVRKYCSGEQANVVSVDRFAWSCLNRCVSENASVRCKAHSQSLIFKIRSCFPGQDHVL